MRREEWKKEWNKVMEYVSPKGKTHGDIIIHNAMMYYKDKCKEYNIECTEMNLESIISINK